jgi:hypothetical protein
VTCVDKIDGSTNTGETASNAIAYESEGLPHQQHCQNS